MSETYSGGSGRPSRVISVADAPACQLWQAPPVSVAAGTTPATLQSGEDLEQIRERARREGFEAGRQEGLETAVRDAAERVARLDEMISALEAPFEALDAEIEEQILSLVRALTRQIVRREMRADPTQVIGVIREALGTLPATARGVRVHLHPEDAAVVRSCLAGDDASRAWRIEEDPVMARGGCRVTTRTSEIDAQLDNRLTHLIAKLLGGERAGDA